MQYKLDVVWKLGLSLYLNLASVRGQNFNKDTKVQQFSEEAGERGGEGIKGSCEDASPNSNS